METDFFGPALPTQFGEEVQSTNNPNVFVQLSKEALGQEKT